MQQSDMLSTSFFMETIADLWLELVLFAVATICYAVFGGDIGCVVPVMQSTASDDENRAVPLTQPVVGPNVCEAPQSIEKPKATPEKPKSASKAEAERITSPQNMQAAINTIRARGHAKDLRGAIAVFKKLQASGTTLNVQVHNCLIDAHLQCEDLSGALNHFKGMSRTGMADIVTYNTVLNALLRKGYTEKAQALLRDMAAKGMSASKVTFHELLHAKVVACDEKSAWSLIDAMRAADLPPDAVTCSILVKILQRGACASSIERVMKLVAEVGGTVDEVLLSSVVEACIRTRRMDLLSNVMSHFEREGCALQLTAPSYGSLIKAYGQAKDMDRVWGLWREMQERGVVATSVTLGCMVAALTTNGFVDDAWDLVQLIHENEQMRTTLNTVIYSTVLKGFSLLRQVDRVFLVYAEMSKLKIDCNVITYNTIIDACARCGAMDRVPGVLEDMRKSNVEADLVTYSTLVKGYSLAGKVSHGFKVLEEMKSTKNMKPDEILCNSLLEGCAREHRVDLALSLLEQMKELGVAPSNCTLSILVKLLGRSQKLDEAFKVVSELSIHHGFRPNIQVYTCLIQACLHNRRLDKAMEVHATMEAEPSCHADEKAFSVLVQGCLDAGALPEALKVVRSAYGLDATGKRASTPGVEGSLVSEVCSRLSSGSAAQQDAGQTLAKELKNRHGVDVTALPKYMKVAAWKGGQRSGGMKATNQRNTHGASRRA
jgi:pentatricopeptide repeat protein